MVYCLMHAIQCTLLDCVQCAFKVSGVHGCSLLTQTQDVLSTSQHRLRDLTADTHQTYSTQ